MKNDPVKHCSVYKEDGCSHVDGYLCDFPKCSIYQEHQQRKEFMIEKPKEKSKTIAFDFDNVIHKYRKGWADGSIYDELNDDILKLINELLGKGYKVFIMTTRSRFQIKKYFDSFNYEINTAEDGNPDHGMNFMVNDKIPFKYQTFGLFSKFWNKKGICGITNRKAVFDVLIDDRAINFNPQKGISIDKIINFKPVIYANNI